MKIKHLIMILFITLSLYYTFISYEKMILKAKEYGKVEVERFISVVVNHASLAYQDQEHSDLILVERNEAGDIVSVDFDLIKVGGIAQELVNHVESDLNYVANGKTCDQLDDEHISIIKQVSQNKGIVSYIPIASMLNIPIISYLNLKVPLKYEMISNVKSEVMTDIQNYGINHVVVKINIALTIEQNVVSPFFSEPCIFEFNFPLAVKLVNGLVPGYYSVHQG
ncbi:MAG: sporulation protein YunB [Erysipelotrichaceae bacterium]|nr:sporulation protein YunB [Erysipelotrichaceae bacterium]